MLAQNQTKYFFRFLKLCSVLIIAFSVASCDLFFQKELQQDVRLSYYRYQSYRVNDSIESSLGRIQAYRTLLSQAGEDDALITPRKKNMLLSELYTSLGNEYFNLYRLEEAVENSTIAIGFNIANQHAYYNRGYFYQLLGKDSLAIEDYTKTLMNDNNYVDAYYNRAIIFENKKDYPKAVADYSEAVKLCPSYLVDIYNNRGNAYHEMNALKEAIADYNKALEIDSTKAITYCNRAEVYLKLNDMAKANADYKRATELDSTNIQILKRVKAFRELMDQDTLVHDVLRGGDIL